VEARERTVEYYLPPSGPPSPFGVWRDSITDVKGKAAISARIGRLSAGNFSDSKPIGGGASENRIDLGPAYRIYYGVYGDKIILLCGGDKSTQDADIETAKSYWIYYKRQVKQNAKKSKLPRRSPRRPPK
jgi:putative addiction module killer protein